MSHAGGGHANFIGLVDSFVIATPVVSAATEAKKDTAPPKRDRVTCVNLVQSNPTYRANTGGMKREAGPAIA